MRRLLRALRTIFAVSQEPRPEGDDLNGVNVNSCEGLQMFVDGELMPGAATTFRGHLMECRACQRGMVDILALDARLWKSDDPRLARVLGEVARPVHCGGCGADVACRECGAPVLLADVAGGLPS